MPDIGNRTVFFETDAINTTGTNPGWPEGMAPSRVNDAARALQGAVTREWDYSHFSLTSTGSLNAYVLTYTVAPDALRQGLVFAFKTNFAVTGAATLNVNALGAIAIKKDVAGVLTDLASADMASGQYVRLEHDGTFFVWTNWQGPTAATFVGGTLTATTSMTAKAFNDAKGAAVASSGTTDIWTPADGNFLHITGVTTITSLGTAPQAGAERTVIFDNILTLTHNATSLILPGGVSITTAANDRMIVRADTTANMIVVDYIRASGLPVVSPASSIRTLLSTLTTTSGATQSATGLVPATYRWYEIEVSGVSFSGNGALQVATSGNNGANYGAPAPLSQSLVTNTDTQDGFCWIYNINVALQFAPRTVSLVTRSSDGGAGVSTPQIAAKNATGGTGAVNALQFSDVISGTFDAGTIKIYGVL